MDCTVFRTWLSRAGCAAGLAVACSGCSFLFTKRAPADALDAEDPPKCTSSVAAPVVDTAITTFQVVRVALAARAEDYQYQGMPFDRQADIGIGAGLIALFGASAVYGFITSDRCRDVKERWDGSAAPPLRACDRRAARLGRPFPARSGGRVRIAPAFSLFGPEPPYSAAQLGPRGRD
jgi:hypothetical protein